jgi:DNA-directed RNA polymerase subunit RPC12/RpoP
MMNDQLFKCVLCGKPTRFVRKSEKVRDDVVHDFAECEKCGGKVTIMYTNRHIRGLLVKQQNTKPGKRKVALAEEIQSKMDLLKQEMA